MKFDLNTIVTHCERVLSNGDYLPGGIHSKWVDCLELTGLPVGVKFWHEYGKDVFEPSRRMHMKAMMMGVGPKVYHQVKIQGQPGLVMEKVTTAHEIMYQRYPANIQHWDIWSLPIDHPRYRSLIGLKEEQDEKRGRFEKFLRSRLAEAIKKVQKTGIEVYDTHTHNWGFVYGSTEHKESEIRIIDVGNFVQNEVDGLYLKRVAAGDYDSDY